MASRRSPTLLLGLGTLLLTGAVLPTAQAADRRTPIVRAVESASPAVVAIETEMTLTNPFPLWGPATQSATSQGSGVIIDDRGIILTNAHVVEGATTITVHLEDSRSFDARLVGLESDLDLAVLAIDAGEALPIIQLGSSDDLFLGETVIAIGNPYGLGQTVSTGIVSHTHREVEIQKSIVQDYIQTDAAINPGNSGGALVNINGQVIGINTAIYQQAEGIGFAIPINRAHKIAMDLVNYGTVQVPWLGVDVGDVSNRYLAGTPLEEGAVIVDTVHGSSPASRAGLKKGDLLYMLDGRPIHSRADLNAFLAQMEPGTQVALSFYRGTRPMKARLKTVEFPEELVKKLVAQRLGIKVASVSGGVRVENVVSGGAWDRAGLREGDVVVAVNGQSTPKLEDFESALARIKSGHRPSASFTVVRGNKRGTITLQI